MVLAGFVGGFGWCWVVLGGFGRFRVLVTTIFKDALSTKPYCRFSHDVTKFKLRSSRYITSMMYKSS